MAWEIAIFHLKFFICKFLQFLTALQYNSKNCSDTIFVRLILLRIFWPYAVICFDFKIKANYYKGLGEIKTKRNDVEEKKQILSENSIWNFVISHAIPKWFSSIKVGLCTFLNLNSSKTKINNLKIHLNQSLKIRKVDAFPTACFSPLVRQKIFISKSVVV